MSPKKQSLLWSAAVAGAALALPGFYTGLRIRRYGITTGKLTQPLRIALVSDFHAADYGPGAERLVRVIDREAPDLLAITGDLFDRRQDRSNAEALLRGLEGKYPACYVTGNHEYRDRGRSFSGDMALLEKYGAKRLSGERVTMTLQGQAIDLCGVDDPDAVRAKAALGGECESFRSFFQQLSDLREQPSGGNYTILLTHRPEHFRFYACPAFDLVLCGHAHGGQWRIPGVLNGLYAPNQGLFPPYAGGEYHKGTTTMIVSRGLAKENTRVPRFYDPPELVIIDLK